MALTDKQRKKFFADLNKKSNRQLNDILNQPHNLPEIKKEIDRIFDLRTEKDPEFQEHRAESFFNGLSVDQKRRLLKKADVPFFVEFNANTTFDKLSADIVQKKVIKAVNEQHRMK